MANFTHETFTVFDDWMTPKHAWENIKEYIPDKVIWEPFYGDGKSGHYLTQLGFNVIHEPLDFFENNLGEIIVSNPPFSQSKAVMARLKELDKPFIIIFPTSKINTSYMRQFTNSGLHIIIPLKRIHFKKMENGSIVETKNSCNFDCFYYCYKIGLPNDIVWL